MRPSSHSFARCLIAGLCAFITNLALPGDIVINPGRISFDTQASTIRLPDGGGMAIWKAYHRSKERVLTRVIGADQVPASIIQLNATPAVIDHPLLTASSNGRHIWAFWAERDEGHWHLRARQYSDQKWLPIVELSGPADDAIKPSAVVRNDGSVIAGWHEFTAGNAVRARLRQLTGGKWIDPVTVSNARHDSFRLALVEVGDTVWAFWDQYADLRYSVLARSVSPRLGPIESVSPDGPASVRCMTPHPIHSPGQGLCVAWLKMSDVIGGDGVIDMIHTAHVSIRQNGQWKLVRDEQEGTEGAVMLNGLLPDLRPGKRYPSGYIGRRRHPMLLAGENKTWLVWERKSQHSGGATKTKGQLLGRPFTKGRWGDSLILYDQLNDYRLTQPALIQNGSFSLTGSQLPRGWMRPYHRVDVDLKSAQPFKGDDWRNQFKEVDLPSLSESKRHSIEVDGKTYQLFWADLHCHSGLTGDAEGEPDEIILYGRDRAKLDVMVLQDNDDVHGCLLTEGEYYLGMLHSQRFTRPGRFLALPGYEWTQRRARPGVKFDPWKSVYEQPNRGTYPNHRTIIYPSSGGPIVRYTEVGGDFSAMTKTVEKFGGLVNSQHRTFDISDSPAEANMEVTSCWGIYIHDVPEKFHGELDGGHRLGFIGCSDSHRRNPGLCGGLTGIYAEALSDEAILRALREHRCFASNGSKIVVDSRLDGRLSDTPLETKARPLNLALHAIGTRPIVSAILVTNGGRHLGTFTGNGTRELKISHRVDDLRAGDHWFYWEIHQEGLSTQYSGNISVGQGHLAWSSPHFVTVR